MAEQPFPSLPFHHEPLPSKSSIRLVSLVHDASGDLPPMIQGVPLIRLSRQLTSKTTLTTTPCRTPGGHPSGRAPISQSSTTARTVFGLWQSTTASITSAGTYGSFSTKLNKPFQIPGITLIQMLRSVTRSITKRRSSLQPRMAGCIE